MMVKKKLVLLADDEPESRETLKMAAEAWGYDVCEAQDGEEALALFRLKSPNLVLSDMVMPKLNGLGLLRVIKREQADAIVVLFTAYARVPEAVAAIKEGATDLLTKPIDFRRLKCLLDSCLANGEKEPEVLLPANSGYRQLESNLTLRDQRPQSTFHNAGFQTSRPGGRLSAPGSAYRER